MGRQVEIAAGKSNVNLPDGFPYAAGAVVELTDDEFALIPADLIPSYIIDRGEVRDTLANTVEIASGKTNVLLPNGLRGDAGDKFNLTGDQFAQLSATVFSDYVINRDDKVSIVEIPISLPSIADGVIARIKPNFAGRVAQFAFVVTTAVTTAAKTTTLNLDVGGKNFVGGALVITSALATPAGKEIAASAITPAANEQQTITVDADAGTYTVSFDGQTTAAIASEAAASAVQTALRALSNLADADVSVAGSAGGPYTVTFTGARANTNVPAMTTDAALLTGGAGTAVVATTVGGASDLFDADDDIILEATSTTTFIQGAGILRLVLLKS